MAQYSHKKILADGATITIDHSEGYNIYRVTLGGNRTLAVNNSVDLDMGTLIVYQDATGSRTLTFGGVALPLNTTANAATILTFVNDGGTVLWDSSAGVAASSSADTTAPVIVSGLIQLGTPNQVVLTASEALDPAYQPATSTFAVLVNGSAATVSTVVVSGSKITLTLSANVTAGQTVTAAYTKGATPVRDLAGNQMASFTAMDVTNSVDANAAAYFTANGVTNATYQNAVNDFVTGLKSAGLYTKGKGMWIMWDSLAQSKFNLFDPQDTDAAFRLTQTGTGTFAQGFTNTLGNADGLYTKLKPSTINASGYLTRMVSVKTNLAGTKVDFGLLTTSAAAGSSDWLISRSTADQAWMRAGLNSSAADIKAAVATGVGRLYGVTKSGGSVLYKDGVSQGTISFTVNSNTINDYVIGNGGSSATTTVTGLPSERKISLAALFVELTATEITSLDTLIANLETALSR